MKFSLDAEILECERGIFHIEWSLKNKKVKKQNEV
jgi:hypothetical protein